MTKHCLADRDVLRRFVRPRTLAVTEAMPAETLAFGDQPQLYRGWLDEFGVHGLPPQRLFAITVQGSKDKVLILVVRGLLTQLVQSCRKSLAHRDRSLACAGLGTPDNLSSAKHLFNGDFVFVPLDVTPAKCKALRDSNASSSDQQYGNVHRTGKPPHQGEDLFGRKQSDIGVFFFTCWDRDFVHSSPWCKSGYVKQKLKRSTGKVRRMHAWR